MPSTAAAISVKLNGVQTKQTWESPRKYVMYFNTSNLDPNSPWKIMRPFTADFEIKIDNSIIEEWPAVSIRAGNFTDNDDVAEVTGGAYLTNLGSGKCEILDPNIKPPEPPPAIKIDMAVPDWNLGELQRGENDKTFSNPAQQICFRYFGKSEVISRRFVIDATNQNGTSAGKFLLRNVKKADQVIPYSVTLDSGIERFNIPNQTKGSINLNKEQRTCFVPTFKTVVDYSIDTGNYSDVLSFTIVTKS